MLLRPASLLIAKFEFYISCAVLAGSIGSLVATAWNEKELKGTVYSKHELDFLYISYAWHLVCSVILLISSIVLLYAYLKRSFCLLRIFLAGLITGHILHLGGLYFSFFLAPVYDAIIVLTFVRAYFVWVVHCFFLEIKMYPEGFPPPPKNFKEPEYDLPGPTVTADSTLRILGDG
jgi:hypothetical protein